MFENANRAAWWRQALMRSTAIVTMVSVLAAPLPALAQPQGADVRHGDVTITVNGRDMRIDQRTRAAIINWQRFGIGPDEALRFRMPDGSSTVLNRVTGPDISRLRGLLEANGKVFLINRNGIVIGRGAVINTNGFVASTLDMADQDFLAGKYNFLGDTDKGVVNYGLIEANNGDVVLIGHTVENAGTIRAPNGTAALAAGSDVRYLPGGDRVIQIRAGIEGTGAETGVDNSGVIEAARAELEAAGGSVYDLAVNQSGVIRATAASETEGGRIILTSAGGAVTVSGTMEARRGDDGGEILVGGSYQGKEDPAIANAATVTVTEDAVLDADAGGSVGDGGRVIVWADEATDFRGTITARGGDQGGDGGFAEISAKYALMVKPTAVDLRAPQGLTGTLLLDPSKLKISGDADKDRTETTPYAGTTRYKADDNGGYSVLNVGTLETQLAGANVEVWADEEILVSSPISWATGNELEFSILKADGAININQSVRGPNGDFHLTLTNGTTVNLATGAVIEAKEFMVTAPFGAEAGNVSLNGPLKVDDFKLSLGTMGLVSAPNTNNRIDTVTFNDVTMDGFNLYDGAGGLSLKGDPKVVRGDHPKGTGDFIARTEGDLTLERDDGTYGDFQFKWTSSCTPICITGGRNYAVFEADGGAFINRSGERGNAIDSERNRYWRIYFKEVSRSRANGLTGENAYGETYETLGPDADSIFGYNYFIESNPAQTESGGTSTGSGATRPDSRTEEGGDAEAKDKPVTFDDETNNRIGVFTVKFDPPEKVDTGGGSSIVISEPPDAPAGDQERRAVTGGHGQTVTQGIVKDMLENWPGDEPPDDETRAFLEAVANGSITVNDLMDSARAGDAAATLILVTMMPTLVNRLAKLDPDQLTHEEQQLLAKAKDRINQRRQEIRETAQAKLDAYIKERARQAGVGFNRLVMTQGFPSVADETVAEVNARMQEKFTVLASAGVASTGAGVALSAVAVAAASALFPHAVAGTGVGAGYASAATAAAASSAAAGAAAGAIIGVVLVAGVAATAAIINLVEAGENEEAFNQLMRDNQPITGSLGDARASGQLSNNELIMASTQLVMEMIQ